MSNRRNRIDAWLTLQVLAYIARYAGVSLADLEQITGQSRATTKRLLRTIRTDFGVTIAWRQATSYPAGGEYSIEDWGGFRRPRGSQAGPCDFGPSGTKPREGTLRWLKR